MESKKSRVIMSISGQPVTLTGFLKLLYSFIQAYLNVKKITEAQPILLVFSINRRKHYSLLLLIYIQFLYIFSMIMF